jgi:hypothetical protein
VLREIKEKMDGESIDIKQTKLEKLKELFPELFVESQFYSFLRDTSLNFSLDKIRHML